MDDIWDFMRILSKATRIMKSKGQRPYSSTRAVRVFWHFLPEIEYILVTLNWPKIWALTLDFWLKEGQRSFSSTCNIRVFFLNLSTGALVVKRFKISDTYKFGTDSRTGIAFLGSKLRGTLVFCLVSNCIPKSFGLSRLAHWKFDDLVPTQPFH